MPSSPSGCAGLWFVSWWDMSHCSVSVGAPVWGVLSFMCVTLSLCSHVLVPGDVISGGHVVSDWSSGSMCVWIFILSNLIWGVHCLLSDVRWHIFSSFLFTEIEWRRCMCIYHNKKAVSQFLCHCNLFIANSNVVLHSLAVVVHQGSTCPDCLHSMQRFSKACNIISSRNMWMLSK